MKSSKSQLLNLHPDKKEQLFSLGKEKTVTAKTYFILAHEIPRKFGYIMSGLFRYVYINEEGHEITKGIIKEQSFISSYTAMVNESPSYFFIEALEDSKIIEFSYSKWKDLRASDPFWDKLLVSILEKAFATKEKRERDLLLLNAETRYQNFLTEFPGIERRIRQNLIASYLGILPESLSRIRKKIQS